MFSTSKRDILKIKMKHSLLINYNIDYFIIAEYRWPWLLRKGDNVTHARTHTHTHTHMDQMMNF